MYILIGYKNISITLVTRNAANDLFYANKDDNVITENAYISKDF